MEQAEAIEWARTEATRLNGKLEARGGLAQAQEFLHRFAPDSAFHLAATDLPPEMAQQLRADAQQTVASALAGWADFAEAGLANATPYHLRFRVDAATDFMEQVQTLLDDPKTHPAAPVMLAGAALEEFLRGLVETTAEVIKGSPSITKYGEALKRAGLLDKTDAKDLVSMAGTRNDAAHGDFDSVTRERALLFAERVNHFLTEHV